MAQKVEAMRHPNASAALPMCLHSDMPRSFYSVSLDNPETRTR